MSTKAAETPDTPGALDRLRDRVMSDYLAISRNSGTYARTDDYLAAEERAWERLHSVVVHAVRRHPPVSDT
ncbi:MAG: hypothetical protein EXQ74_04805 [Thermoleophilia bacterium]|nr:hypothetical protein [Thermoleophilia bacterium]